MDNKLEELFWGLLSIPFVVGVILLFGWMMSWGDGINEANEAHERYQKQRSQSERILQEWERVE